MGGDLITLDSDLQEEHEALILPAMRNGKRIKPLETLEKIRGRCEFQLLSMPEYLKTLAGSPEPYVVELSPKLIQLSDEVDRNFA